MRTMKTTRPCIKSYSELIKIDSYEERLNYLRTESSIGAETFGGYRYINQILYLSYKWKNKTRKEIILRDNGCDVAHEDYPIYGEIYIHHINPITIEDIINESSLLYDPENLVCVSFKSHNFIHFSTLNKKEPTIVTRKPNDTCPWR